VDFQLINKNHGILTHKTCPAIDRFEYFNESRLKHSCDICLLGMPISGEMLDKNIKCKPLKLPPRIDTKDIACQWEYKLEIGRLGFPFHLNPVNRLILSMNYGSVHFHR